MPVTATVLTNDKSEVSGSSKTTASISPTANRLILCAVSSNHASTLPNEPTVSGCSLTWVKIDSNSGGTRRITLFRALGASPTTGTLTISFGGQNQANVHWAVVECANVDTSGTNGSGAVRQSALGTGSGTHTSTTATLAAFGNANNATFGCFEHPSGTAVTEGSGFTELSETTTSSAITLQTEFKNSNDTSVDWTYSSTTVVTRAIAIEIVYAAEIQLLNLGGTVTSAAVPVRATATPKAGAITSSAVLIRAVSKRLVGSISTAAAIVRAPSKGLTGSVASAAAIVQSASKSLAGSAFSAGSAVRFASNVFSGSIASAGAKIFAMAAAFLASIVTTGSISRSGTRIHSGVISSASTFTKHVASAWSGLLASAGAAQKMSARIISGGIASSGTLVRQLTALFSGILGSLSNLVAHTAKGLTGAVASAGSVSAVRVFLLTLIGTLSSAASIVRGIGLRREGNTTSSGIFSRSISKCNVGLLQTSGLVGKHIARLVGAVQNLIGVLLAELFSGATRKVRLTLFTRASLFTLANRAFAFSLESRTSAVSLEERTSALSLKSRSTNLTVAEREND